MQMSDMLLQMALMNTWQTLQTTVASGQTNAGNATQQTTFQDLLEQRRNDLSSSDGSTGKDLSTSETDSQPVEKPQDGSETVVTDSDVAAFAAGQVLMNNLVVPVEQAVAQPETTVAAPVQMVTTETVVQENAMPLAAMPTQQEGQPTAQAPVLDAAGETDPQAAVSQPAAEVVTPSQQTGSAEDFSQQLTQSDAGQEPKNQMAEEATVQSWHTPLFRDVEATPVRVGDSPVDMTAPTQDVEKTLSQTLQKALDQGSQSLEIRLSPANLGNVVAEFTRNSDGALHIVLRADTEQAAKLLSHHASSLSLMLQDSTHAEVRVEVPQPQQEQTAWQQPDQNGGQQQRQQQQQQQQQPRREAESFLHQLRLGLVQMETQAV